MIEAPVEWIPDQDYGIGLVKNMLSVRQGGKIRISSCDASMDVFNTSLFMEASRTVKDQKQAEIVVLTGPVIMARADGSSGLLELASEGVVNLTSEIATSSLNHLYHIEQENEDYLYIEEGHKPFTVPDKGRFRLNPKWETVWRWQHNATVNRHNFDGFVNLVTDTAKKFPDEYGLLPLLATQQGLGRLIEFTRGRLLSYMIAIQLLELPIAKEVFLP